MKKPSAYPLNTIYFYPTESCNLKCRHCWIEPHYAESSVSEDYLRQNDANLTFEEIQAVADDALPLGLNSVKLTGGEPFLHPRIMDYLRLFADKGLFLIVETNGTLLEERHIVEMKKLGCTTSVSLDGGSAGVHDAFRGVSGSYDKTMGALELMKKHGYSCEVIFSLHPLTKAGLVPLIEHLDALGGFRLKLNIMSPVGRAKRLAERSETIDIADIIALHKTVREDYAHRYRRVSIELHIPPAFTPASAILNGSRCCNCRIFNIIGLLSDGKVSYCGIGRVESGLILGNIRERRLSDIWKNSPQLLAFRRDMPESLKGVCGACIHRNHCIGSCVAQTYSLTKDLYGPYAFCEEAYRRGLFPASRLAASVLTQGDAG